MRSSNLVWLFVIVNVLNVTGRFAIAADPIAFRETPGQIVITAGDQPVATYFYADKEITRPFFAHVHVPGGVQITRNHPPIAGKDLVDHGTFHPGIWLAFGDIGGQDVWRNKAVVRHEKFIEKAIAADGSGRFTVRNSYRREDDTDEVVCYETCRYSIMNNPAGYWLVFDSVFHSSNEFAFGDQEEMGLGIRVATPISVKSGGQMRDADGRVNEKEIWGKASAWCDYSGQIEGQNAGLLIATDPTNFRPSRYHARNYGLLTANPFGQKVFGGVEKSRIVVSANEPFRLRYGILLHSSKGKELDAATAYGDFLKIVAELPRPPAQ
ncbi:DUF6807 family protein [Schlesneria paludicola]|uniref:DUF6807 family protein n=1 Tax=Schlesneria paludicola TaxID=360056 RepID=UPI00031582EB|nr:DUF6807 family protein [Schlesneria paludicola]